MNPSPHKEKICKDGEHCECDGPDATCQRRPEKEKREDAGKELFTAPHSGDCLDIGPVVGTYQELLKDNKPEDIKPAAKEGGEWEKEFDEKVNELRTANEYTEEPVDFGFRKVLRDERGNDNLVTATDWGHVKSFIRTLLSSTRKEATEQGYVNGLRDGIHRESVIKIEKETEDRTLRAVVKRLNERGVCGRSKHRENCKEVIIKAAKDHGVNIEV